MVQSQSPLSLPSGQQRPPEHGKKGCSPSGGTWSRAPGWTAPAARLLVQPRRNLIPTPILWTGNCTVIHLRWQQRCTLTCTGEEPGLEGIAQNTKVSFPSLWFEEASGFSPGAIYLMLSNCFRCLMFKKAEHSLAAFTGSCLVDTAPLPVCDHPRQVMWACWIKL